MLNGVVVKGNFSVFQAGVVVLVTHFAPVVASEPPGGFGISFIFYE